MENQNNPNPNSENQNSAEQQNNPQSGKDKQDSAERQDNQQPNQGNENQPPNQEPKNTNTPPPEPTSPRPDEPTPPRHSELGSESQSKIPKQVRDNQGKNNIGTKSKKGWIWWIVISLILAGAVATYFLDLWPDWLSSPISSINEVSEPEESFVPLFPRSSTMPNGSITIQGKTPRIIIYNLEPSFDRQFSYQLVLSGGSSQFEVGSFDGSNEEGEPINLDGSDVKLRSIDDATNYDTATIKIVSRSSSPQTSTIMEGSLVAKTSSVVSADLNFPYLFDRISAGIEMSIVRGGESTINFDATSLPDLNAIGYEYELRLVEFEGPNVAGELTLGRFQGNTTGSTNFTTKTSRNLSRFNQAVVSLEPVWDTNPTISQIKPFSGEI